MISPVGAVSGTHTTLAPGHHAAGGHWDAYPARRRASSPKYGADWAVGAENLRHQAVFMNNASCAVTSLDPESIRVCNAVG